MGVWYRTLYEITMKIPPKKEIAGVGTAFGAAILQVRWNAKK